MISFDKPIFIVVLVGRICYNMQIFILMLVFVFNF